MPAHVLHSIGVILLLLFSIVPAVQAETSGYHDIAFSPDGTRLAAVGPDGLTVYDEDQAVIDSYTFESTIINGLYSVAWSPDGTMLATIGRVDSARFIANDFGHKNMLIVWTLDPLDVVEERLFALTSKEIGDAVVWTEDGLYTNGSMSRLGAIWRWGLENLNVIGRTTTSITQFVVNDGRLAYIIATPDIPRSDLWYSGEVETGFLQFGNTILASYEGEYVVVDDNAELTFYRFGDLRPRQRWEYYTERGGRIWDAAWSPDERYLAIIHADTIKTWDIEAERGMVFDYTWTTVAESLRVLDWHPSGAYVLAATRGGDFVRFEME